MKKVLFIDYDGTLHDSDAKYKAKLDGLLGLNGIDILRAYLQVHRGIVHTRYPEKHDDFFFHQRLLFDSLKKPYEEKVANELAGKFRQAQLETWTNPAFYPDALPFLNKVKDKHILCLTTGDYAPEKAKALEKAGGMSYFSYVFDKDHLGLKGHSNSYYNNAVMSTNSRPEDVIVIGDSPEHDIAAAKGAGLATVWVNRRGIVLTDDLPRPDFEAKDLREALTYIEAL
ncbi:MAG TPA: HAD family hydrolase [Dehalococcoidia bacterium]|nr:HAD family hydrolase [Dehalococcoidia bacterium]